MKLTARQIPAFMQKPEQVQGVLIYGVDRSLVKVRCEDIAARLLQGADAAFNRNDLTAEMVLEDPARLYDALAAMSLLGGKRVVVLRDATDKLSALLDEILSVQPAFEAYLIVCAEELGAKSSLRKLFENKKILAALPCYLEEVAGVTQLVRQFFQQHALAIEPAAVNYLALQLSGDRSLIVSELEKIALYFLGAKRVEKDALATLFEGEVSASLDALVEAFARRDVKRFCLLCDAQLRGGLQPVMLLRSIDRLFARISEVQQLASGGVALDTAVGMLKPPVFYKLQPLYAQMAREWSAAQIRFARHYLMQLEFETKIHHETAETQMQQGLLRLMQRKQPLKAAS